MSKSKLVFNGKLIHQYPGQTQPQDVVADISKNGKVYIHYNSQIGNAIPADIWNGIRRRLTISVTTQAQAREWYRDNKKNIKALIAGMGEWWNGSNYVGTLTDAAQTALDDIKYQTYQVNYANG